MNKSQRIYLNSGDTTNYGFDKDIKVKLEQDVDTLEFMSLKIGTADIYQNFNADYGVLVGRVLANNSIGIPNARISIFIPLTDEDAEDKEIYSFYPYKTPRDKNNDSKRYNLLPRVAREDPNTGIITPKQPFGSFPIKEEILANETFLNVYKKYYKYTALTNNSGDYMIFGVPTGTQTVHLSVDITDIGEYSMTAASMITNLGYSPNLFTDSGNKIKESNDLEDLPNIETQEISVDIIPFWGDIENFEIGITRQDFRIRSTLKNTFIIFGGVFTDGDKKMWGKSADSKDMNKHLYEIYKDGGWSDVGMVNKRVGKVTEKIYYYPANVSDEEIATGNAVGRMLLLDPTEYSFYKKGGNFVLILNCNRDKIIIAEDGTREPVDESFAGGLYTRFRGFMTLEITSDDLNLDWVDNGDKASLKPIRQILKFPQAQNYYVNSIGAPISTDTFRRENIDSDSINDSDAWRRQHYLFCGGCIYSVTKFHGIVYNCGGDNIIKDAKYGWGGGDNVNYGCLSSLNYNTGAILTSNYGFTGNTYYGLCPNGKTANYCNGVAQCYFAANWLNLTIYLPQTGWIYDNYSYQCKQRSNSQFTFLKKDETYYVHDNQQLIAGTYVNTCSFARSDINWTDFIEVPKEDIIAMSCINKMGFKTTANGCCLCDAGTYCLLGNYRNGYVIPTANVNCGAQAISWCAASPRGGGRKNGTCTCTTIDCYTYFFKGYDDSDVIAYIRDLGIV